MDPAPARHASMVWERVAELVRSEFNIHLTFKNVHGDFSGTRGG